MMLNRNTWDGSLCSHIAKTKDGRNILYDVNVNIKEGIAIDKNATSLRAQKLAKQAVKVAMPSNNSKISQDNPKVNMFQ